MNLAEAPALAHRPARLLQAVLASWREITREQIAMTFLLGCAFHVYRMVVSINIRYSIYIFVGDQIKAFILLLAIVAADRLTGKDPDRRGTYALAVLAGVAVAQPVAVLTIWALILLFVSPSARLPGGWGYFLTWVLELLMVAGATVWVINDRRRARAQRDRMHAAELERIAAERRSIESDLQAMQARIEPRFLFNTLSQVKHLYARDAALGAQVLDALIAYLRAAMPKMRGTSSTVEQELGLVRAYLEIVQLRFGRELEHAIEAVDAEVAAARMPAMMLLPLVERAIGYAVADGHAVADGYAALDGRAMTGGSIRIRGMTANAKIRLEIIAMGGGEADEDDDGIAAMRERLAMLYGGEARLVTQRLDAGRHRTVIEIPRQEAPGGDGLVEYAGEGRS